MEFCKGKKYFWQRKLGAKPPPGRVPFKDPNRNSREALEGGGVGWVGGGVGWVGGGLGRLGVDLELLFVG